MHFASIANKQLHLHKFHIKHLKTIKITPTCFDRHQGAMFLLAKAIL